MSAGAAISVVIPAHNEEAVIGRCLTRLLEGARPGELDIVVVCNGCSDRTARVAGAFGPPVRVITTSIASKISALNLGDAHASSFPRFYLDADALAGIGLLREMAAALNGGKALGVSCVCDVDTSGCSRAVKAFFRINAMLPAVLSGTGGGLIYGASEKGRRKFGAFPDIIADDTFFRLQFAAREWKTVTGARTTGFAPTTLGSLIRIKSRSYFGNRELRLRSPKLWAMRHPGTNVPVLRELFKRPLLWPDLAVYLFVRLASRARALLFLAKAKGHWDRDQSSRDRIADGG